VTRFAPRRKDFQLDPTLAIRSKMLASLMAALEIAPARAAGGEQGAKTLTGRLTRLEADGAAELKIGGQTVSLAIRPEAFARAQAALGSLVALKIEISPDSGEIQARFIGNGAPEGPDSSSLPAAQASPLRQATAPAQPPHATPAAPPAPPAQRLNAAPQLALSQAVARASASQLEMGPLFAVASQLAEPATLALLPPQMRQQVAHLLNLRLEETALSQPSPQAGKALSEAVARSGVTYEARLATGAPPQTATVGADLKSVLMQLLGVANSLKSPPADDAPPARGMPPAVDPVQPASPPPHRDAAPRGQPPTDMPASFQGAEMQEAVATLARQAEGALERVRLLQAASLPDAKPQGEIAANQQQRWHFELPMALSDGRTQILPLRIEREAARRQAMQGESPGWRVHFALDGEPLGAIQAVVTWRMRQIGVSIFAARADTREALRAQAGDLRRGLDRAGIEGVEIDIAAGRAPEPKPATGRLLDQVT
jgi:hypothetical protein